MLYIGTSGFSYKDWIGTFYPENTEPKEMIKLYAQKFKVTEINSTYYRIPHPASFYYLQQKVPAEFKFVVKANQGMTHSREENPTIFKDFKESIKPLSEAGKFACVLAQFPYSFYNTPSNWDYILRFKERMEDIALVVEFRNSYWINNEIFRILKNNNIGFCCVDQPQIKGLIPPLAEATSNLGYIRFHGRNKANWWEHEKAYQRYDYLYTEEELKEWIPKIKKIAAKTTDQYIFMNNHYKGKAVKNALMLIKLLREEIKAEEIKEAEEEG
jgi:uncharacterized protein YecE (DUF72 family)